MPPISRRRPNPDEYSDYHRGYVDAVPDGDILDTLADQARALQVLLRGMDATWGTHRYAPGKWSVNEVVGHLTDAERIFCNRALRFARNDATELPGFDHDAFVRAANFDGRKLRTLLDEYAVVREGTHFLFQNLSEEELDRRGVANGQEVTVRALAWIIAGHERHHQRLLREKYLSSEPA